MREFELLTVRTSTGVTFHESQANPSDIEDINLYVHPAAARLDAAIENRAEPSGISVNATASGRTVITGEPWAPYYLKLHYPGVLGRVFRHLPLRKAIAGVEVSHLVSEAILAGRLPELGLLPETEAIGLPGPSGSWDDGSWAHIRRDGRPRVFRARPPGVLLPSFSLVASERGSADPTLIVQLLAANSTDPVSWVRDQLVLPLVRSYLALTFDAGLMPEINAQNLLYDFGPDGTATPVLRDMGRVEKLLHIAPQLGGLLSAPYKTLDGNRERRDALTRHSFSFDFKLMTYVVEPILSALDAQSRSSSNPSREVLDAISRLIDDQRGAREWLPRGRTVQAHPHMLLTEDRPYVDAGRPLAD